MRWRDFITLLGGAATWPPAAEVPEEDFFVLSSLPPSRAQQRLALAVVAALFVTFLLAVGPLSHIQTSRVAAFVPAYTTALVLSEGITAYLLFNQFALFRTRALLVISSGYLFATLMAIAWFLMFPGVFVPEGLIGGIQGRAYVYFFWHAGFPIFVIAYALIKDADPKKRDWNGTARARIVLSVILTVVVVSVLTGFFAVHSSALPRLELAPLRFSPLWLYFVASMISLTTFAFLALWIQRRSILDLWLMVVMLAYGIEIWLSYPIAYGFGWYVSRIFGLFSSSLVLWVLLYEIARLYAVTAIVRVQRAEASLRTVEAELARVSRVTTLGQFAASIAHEIKQPISAVHIYATASMRFLDRCPPDLDEVRETLARIVDNADRAADIIDRIRDHIKKAPPRKKCFDLNEAINEVIELARSAITDNKVSVQTRLAEGVLAIHGDRVQLQQVLLNLILNAVEAMGSVEVGLRELLIRTEQDHTGVLVAVHDSGPGIDATHLERVFEAFYTTKPGGIGMGLLICRSIIDAHGGKLWAEANKPRGTVFQFALPAAKQELTNPFQSSLWT